MPFGEQQPHPLARTMRNLFLIYKMIFVILNGNKSSGVIGTASSINMHNKHQYENYLMPSDMIVFLFGARMNLRSMQECKGKLTKQDQKFQI